MLTDVVGGSVVKKSFMDRFPLMSPSIYLSALHTAGLEVCVLTQSVQLHALCVASWGFSSANCTIDSNRKYKLSNILMFSGGKKEHNYLR